MLGTRDLAGLLDDAYQLSNAGQLSIAVCLGLMMSLAVGTHLMDETYLAVAHILGLGLHHVMCMQARQGQCLAVKTWQAY